MFEITITEKTIVRQILRGEWCVVSEKDGIKKYDYAPSREGELTQDVEIYKQQVGELDLVAVINAVNGGKNVRNQS